MSSASLLIELHTEELPPKALPMLAAAFAAGIERGLRANNFLSPASVVTSYGSPRRLAVHVTQVVDAAPDRPFRQRLLPVAIGLDKLGNATAALLKKLTSLGATIDPASLKRESDGKQDVLVYEGVHGGVSLALGLQSILDDAIAQLPVPKMMNYQLADGTTTVQFVRPVHRLVAMFGHAVVPVTAFGLAAGTKTFGHRFASRGEMAIHSADTYADQIEREGKVLASFARRRARIVELLQSAATRLNAQAIMPAALLDEVTALVNWPVVYESGFDAEFLTLPAECLVLTMQQNQKYFALQGADAQLLNRFLLVSQIEANDGGAAIIAGNARVLRARLADAKFFFDQDRRQPLHERVPGLAQIVYHHKLGTLGDRVERLVNVANAIAVELGADRAHAQHVARAAWLAKADLRTLMVGEFPELQGIMGRYYARHDGEVDAVANAIEEHYRPRFAGDSLAESMVGTCVALADKLDALVGLFGIGERPTGDKDPFALRRHALGVLRMLIERKLPLELLQLTRFADAAFANARFPLPNADLIPFFYERLRGLLREQGYSANEVEAVLALKPQRLDDIIERLVAVRAFMSLPEAASLAAANKRIGNILKKSDRTVAAFDSSLLFEPAEQNLAAAFVQLAPRAESHFGAGDFSAGLLALAPLRAPVDVFFDEVMVNVDDPRLRGNRLALLAQLRALMNRVADISLLAAG